MRIPECTCPVEHTVTRLGHCRTCDAVDVARRAAEAMTPLEDVVAGKLANMDDPMIVFSCGGNGCPVLQEDGAHFFGWATYADDLCSYGVCRCGLTEIDFDIMRMP
jgi:hypothetical protein